MQMEPEVTLKIARERGLTEAEYQRACASIGRTPTYAELGVFSAMWSEHCSYKSSRVHLKRLPTQGPRVIQGPGENAGVVDIGDGFCVVFKMESHNHPSFIEPYQGAATGVGGILRDVFTMGARPVAAMNSLRFGSPQHPRTRSLLSGVVAGIAGYGNAFGVPTVGGELTFDPAYDTNILVNAFALGVARTDKLFFGRAKGLGNPVIYVGARTGRDGVHGATMASAEFTEGAKSQRPTVQVGDPFMGKLLLEACLEIFAMDVLEGVQDMGAAGLTSSSVEMAARASNGIEIDLDLVPRRARNMLPYELLLSESQERMLMVAKAGCEQQVLDVCKKWDLDAVVIGRVTDTQRFVIRATPGYCPLAEADRTGESKLVVDLPIDVLTDEAPKYERPCVDDPRPRDRYLVDVASLPFDPRADLLKIVGSPNVGSRSWVYRQYDHIVRVGTVVRPGAADAAVLRLFCNDGARTIEKTIAVAADCNPRLCELDPYQGGAMAVAEACRNLACVGAEAIGLTDCLNFASPERPVVMASFRDAIDGLRDACNALRVPIVSGNVSLYNETQTEAGPRGILPTPSIGAVGILDRAQPNLTMAFQSEGDRVVLLGPWGKGKLGGSEWLVQKTGRVCGEPPSIDLQAEARLQSLLIAAARQGLFRSAHDCSEGGLLGAVAESCIAGNKGATIRLPRDIEASAGVLFGEDPSRVVVSLGSPQRALLNVLAQQYGVEVTDLGEVRGDGLVLEGVFDVSVLDLSERFAAALSEVVGDVAVV